MPGRPRPIASASVRDYSARMTELLAARSQMALSLGFHIVFAAIGVAMPLLMAIAHARWLRTGDEVYRTLTKAWSKGVAIFFAVGAVGLAAGAVLYFGAPHRQTALAPVVGPGFAGVSLGGAL